jgi:PAS domain S-box-containing protein
LRIAHSLATGPDERGFGKAVSAIIRAELNASSAGIVLKRRSPASWQLYSSASPAVLDDRQLGGITESDGRHRLVASCIDGAKPIGYLVAERRGLPFSEREARLFSRAAQLALPILLVREETLGRIEKMGRISKQVRENDERLRAFFNESRDLIYIANADDVVATINAAGLAMLGVKDRFEAVGEPLAKWFELPEERKRFLEKLHRHGSVSEYEIVLSGADGAKRFCVETAQVLRNHKSEVVEVLGIIRDISTKVEAERELLKMNMELAEANAQLKNTRMLFVQREKLASIGQLSAGIAHEINNPLGFLKSNHEVLKRFMAKTREAWRRARDLDAEGYDRIAAELDLDYVYEESLSLLGESDEGYVRIINIVQNLRNFSRTETGGASEAYNLESGIESTLTIAKNETKYVADVELRFGGLPTIDARAGEINQVLLNIIVNAAQALGSQKRSEQGHIRVTTRLKDDFVLCDIEDDGPGIPEDLRLRVLDPFFTTKAPGTGTGLGLSISYDIIVNKHGGQLSVEESSLGGALFRIALPIYAACPAKMPRANEIAPPLQP